jgi:hypothetical protein
MISLSKLCILFGLVLFPIPVSPGEIDPLGEKILRFQIPWNIFFRNYFGCPMTPEARIEDCREGMVTHDRVNWVKSCEAAIRLFGFKLDKKVCEE